MSEIESNIFRITNLGDLSSKYRTYRIVNLHKDQDEYYQNRQHITRKLSFRLRSPVAVIEEHGEPVLVVKDDAPAPPKDMFLVRTQVVFEPLADQVHLDYTVRSPKNDDICMRFISFLVQNPLRVHRNLWQPGSGKAFFERQPCNRGERLNMYRGYSIRPILTPSGDIGLCVDAVSKLVFNHALPTHLDRQEFQRFKGQHFIYHFGLQWYEVTLTDFSAFNVSQQKFPINGKPVVLYDYILDQCEKPLPPEIANLSKNCAVVMYNDNREDKRSAAANLCYRVVGNDDPTAQDEFPSLSIEPGVRRQFIHSFVENYLKKLRFGDSEMKVSSKPISTTPKLFPVPDFQFGCSTTLSTRATPGTIQVSLDDLGLKRLSLLKDKSVGFYEASPLDNFCFFMPQSVHETFGPALFNALCATVDDLFPQESGFSPQFVSYADRNARTFQQICAAIFSKAASEVKRGGFAVVMIPENQRRRPRQEDTSASHIIQQLREQFDLRASVIHTTVGHNCYGSAADGHGRTVYKPKDQRAEKRLKGYFRNVAINKILLLNQKWPFVLATPMHADAIVGIDVKGNMAGFIATNKSGNIIVPFHRKSQQKEKLMPKQCKDYFCEVSTRLLQQDSHPLKHIVIHRDGRLYDTEIKGINLGLAKLKADGIVGADTQVTFVEIPKTAPVALRLFDLSITDYGGPHVQNPQIGNYYALNATEGFVCTTGRAFRHGGTAKPLHVIKNNGSMSIEDCLDDVFALSCLAWTRPEDCSRDPITIKLNDRWLGEDGTEHKEETETDDLQEEITK
ncbi:MAG: hypothetical protein HY298_20815 [Verrucomicrobia bacterium]|nr:hypothetical protein [Verrucomicrobiota bacterium]